MNSIHDVRRNSSRKLDLDSEERIRSHLKQNEFQGKSAHSSPV